MFASARRAARIRIISTVDRQARHGDKTQARGFDGYKDTSALTPTRADRRDGVTAGNVGDARRRRSAAGRRSAAPEPEPDAAIEPERDATVAAETRADRDAVAAAARRARAGRRGASPERGNVTETAPMAPAPCWPCSNRPTRRSCAEVQQPPTAAGGGHEGTTSSRYRDARRVTCPAGQIAPLRPSGDGQMAYFGAACAGLRARARCTTSKSGRTIAVGPQSTNWRPPASAKPIRPAGHYKATRPKVGASRRATWIAPPPRRPPRAASAARQDRRRLLAARRSRQPRPPGRARPHPPDHGCATASA